jgi:hypothetical protein
VARQLLDQSVFTESLEDFVQAVKATAPGLDPGGEADSINMLKTV